MQALDLYFKKIHKRDFQTSWSNSRYSVLICDKRCEQKLPQSHWKMLPEVSVCQQVAEAVMRRKLEAFYKLASHRAHRQRNSSPAFCGSVALTPVSAAPWDLGIFWTVNCRCLESEQKMGLSLTSTNLNFYIHLGTKSDSVTCSIFKSKTVVS